MAKRIKKNEIDGLREVKTAGFTATKNVKRDKTVNRRAGLHDKLKNLQGETRVKRRKPLGLRHVRRMRKFAAVASVGVVGAVAVVGVGFLQKSTLEPVEDVGNPTVCFEVPTDGTKPTDHTLLENVGYLNYVLKHQPYWSSQSRTDVDAAVFGVHADQYVKNYKQYYDNVLISADLSFSGVSQSLQYGEQFCQAENAVLSRYSTSTATDDLNKGMDAPWSEGEARGWTLSAFRENRGLPPYDFSVYILDENTVANANEYSVVDNGDGTYSMTLVLNTSTGVNETSADYYYRIQMQANGGLNEKPTIYSTTVTYTFDVNWRVLTLEVKDSYTAKAMGMNTNCTSHTLTTYDYSEEGAYNTFWEDYFKGEYERLKNDLTDDVTPDTPEEPTAMGYLANAFGSVLTEGAVFKIDLNIDALDLSGVVCVEMADGFSLSAKLGDILVWLDGSDLYINDGVSKYKLNTDGLLSSDEESEEGVSTQGLTDALDVNALLDQLTAGEFVFDEETGVATLNCELELFGLKIPMEFEFQKTEEGVELNFLNAQISLGEKTVNATLRFGTESDKPAIPADTSDYQDILNDGVTLDISLKADNFTLDGIAKIIMQNGEFAGVFADLGEIVVYYDCTPNMLYLSVGNVKYKLDISALGTGDAATLSDLGSFDIKTLLSGVLANLTTSESSIGTSLGIDIDALGKRLEAALDIQLKGGFKVDADLTLDKLNVNVTAALTNGAVTLPDTSDYQDVLNSEITLDVGLTLLTGLTDEATGKRDEVTLNGKIALCLNGGNISEIRADFGSVAVYFEIDSEMLYIKVGTTKLAVNVAETDLSGSDLFASFGSGESFINVDLPTAVSQLLNNLVTDGKTIASGLTLEVLANDIPVWAKLDLSSGLSVSAGLSLLGIDAEAQVKLSDTPLERLGAQEKEEYIDLSDGWHKIVESLIGDHISAEVTGNIFTCERTENADGESTVTAAEKYAFTALLDFDAGENGFPVKIDEGTVNADGTRDGVVITVDSTLYLRIKVALEAKVQGVDSMYLDLIIMNANPSVDDVLDIYLSLSKFEKGGNPLKIHASADEILNIAAMGCALVDVGNMKFENSEEITSAVGEIADVLDKILISKILPDSVQDKFASLGESLLPQILGTSLQGFLDKLIGDAKEDIDEAQDTKIPLTTEYVTSITTTDNSLKFILNSSAIYNKVMDDEDNLTVEFTRFDNGGVYFVDGISLKNIYFGDNQTSKLNLGLKLKYDEVAKANVSDLTGYFDIDGISSLLYAAVNSATHSSDKMDAVDKILYAGAKEVPEYLLNHDYYISGQITMEILGKAVPITVNGFSAHIDENNDVSLNANLFIPKTKVLGITAVSSNTNLELTIKDGLIYLKRTVGGSVEYRIMTLDAFTKDIMNQIKFMFNLSNFINSIMDSATGSGNKTPLTFDDYGDYISKLIKNYTYNANGNVWDIVLNGSSIGGLAGIALSDISVSIGADNSTVDGSLVVDSLGLGLTMFSVIKISGELHYLNPQYKWVNNADKSSTTRDLSVSSEASLGGLSWTEVLAGGDYASVKGELIERNADIAKANAQIKEDNKNLPEEAQKALKENLTLFDIIKEHTDWAGLTSHLNTKDYLRFGNGINLALGNVQYLIENEVSGNISYANVMDGVNVLYYGNKVFTYYESDTEVIKATAAESYDLTRYDELKYTAFNGEFKYEFNYKATEYDRVNITLVSKVPVSGFAANGGSYERELNFIDGCPVQLSGMKDINAYKFGGFYSDAEFKNEITEFTATEGLRIYVKWVPKEVEITYASDVEYSAEYNVQEIDGTEYYVVSTASGAMNYETVTINGTFGSTQNLTFLGWFAKLPDGTYKYVTNADGLRTVIDGFDYADSEVIDITLWAVWECDYTLKATYAKYTYKGLYGEFTVRGEFNLTYNSELSLEILNNSDVAVKTYLTYGSGNNNKMSDTYESEVEFDYSTIDLTHTCAAINSYGWLTVKVAYVQNGNEIKSTSKTDHVKRS